MQEEEKRGVVINHYSLTRDRFCKEEVNIIEYKRKEEGKRLSLAVKIDDLFLNLTDEYTSVQEDENSSNGYIYVCDNEKICREFLKEKKDTGWMSMIIDEQSLLRLEKMNLIEIEEDVENDDGSVQKIKVVVSRTLWNYDNYDESEMIPEIIENSGIPVTEDGFLEREGYYDTLNESGFMEIGEILYDEYLIQDNLLSDEFLKVCEEIFGVFDCGRDVLRIVDKFLDNNLDFILADLLGRKNVALISEEEDFQVVGKERIMENIDFTNRIIQVMCGIEAEFEIVQDAEWQSNQEEEYDLWIQDLVSYLLPELVIICDALSK